MATEYVSAWMTGELQALRDVAREFFESEAAPQMGQVVRAEVRRPGVLV
jgi:hypothetical protein